MAGAPGVVLRGLLVALAVADGIEFLAHKVRRVGLELPDKETMAVLVMMQTLLALVGVLVLVAARLDITMREMAVMVCQAA